MPAAAAIASTSPPELPLTEGRLWCELIERRCGLHFPESQWRHLRRRLWERMRIAAKPTYAAYYDLIAGQGAGAEAWLLLQEDLLNAETAFFRHQPSFAALETLWRPGHSRSSAEPRAMWSAGCSTGEEAYSLAMAAAASTGGDARAEIVGTDLNRRVLERARAGVYPGRQVAGVPALWRARFLSESGRGGQWQVNAGLSAQVRFETFHLLDSNTYPRREFDVIFCFNVLVYFRPAARQQAAAALLTRLKPGGHLFLAPGEAAGLDMTGAGPVRMEGTHIWRRAS